MSKLQDNPLLVKYKLEKDLKTNEDYLEETDKVHEGKPVRVSKSGKHFIFVVSKKSNNPYCKYIKKLAMKIVSNKKNKSKLA